MNRKAIKISLAVAVLVAITGCAELSAGLEQVNGVLGSLNGSGDGGGLSSQEVSLGSVSGRGYEINNLKAEIMPDNPSGWRRIQITGTGHNRTNTNITVVLGTTVYDPQGRQLKRIAFEAILSPGSGQPVMHLDIAGVPNGTKIGRFSRVTHSARRY